MAKTSNYKGRGSVSVLSESKREWIINKFAEDERKHSVQRDEVIVYKVQVQDENKTFYSLKDPLNNTKLKRVPRKYFRYLHLPEDTPTKAINLISTDIKDLEFLKKLNITSIGSR